MNAHGVARAAIGATVLAAACACSRQAPNDKIEATPLDSARFYADADSAGAIIAAFDGTVKLFEERAVVRIDLGTVEQDAVLGNLTLAFGVREPDRSWRVVTAGRALAPERWLSRPGVVWTPLELEVPLPADAQSSGGALLLVLDRHSTALVASPIERLFIPIHVGRR